MIDQDVRQAIRLVRQGDKAQAQELLKQALRRDPSNADAWIVLAQVVDNRAEAISYVKRAVNLRPGDERSRRFLDYLLEQERPTVVPPLTAEAAPGPSNVTILALAAVALAVCLGLLVAYILLRPGAEQTAQATATGTPIDCETLVAQALELSDRGCQSMGPNEVCYGHSTIDATLAPHASDPFDSIGDRVRLDMMEKFVAAPLDLDKKEWGIGVFRVEANVPGALPGQTVTLLVFGDTSIDNQSGDMQAFYFSSGLGSLVCENVPFDGILVRMPDGTGVTFSANGAEITLRGTGVMQAQQGQSMSVSMLSGIGSIFSGGQQQTFGPGQEVSVPLDGLEASGPPSEPVTVLDDALTMACTLMGIGCPGTAIPTVSQADLQATLSYTPDVTAVAEATNTSTSTQRPSTPTHTPSEPTSTQRPGEPTWTPAPTHTPTKTYTPGGPTVTPFTPTTPPPTTPPPTTPPPTTPPPTTPPPTTPPPTTPPVDPCTQISIGSGAVVEPNQIQFNITNYTAGTITLTHLTNVTWPTVSYTLFKIELGSGGNTIIWQGSENTPVANITPNRAGDRTIGSGGANAKILTLIFNPDIDLSDISATVNFDIGCAIPAES